MKRFEYKREYFDGDDPILDFMNEHGEDGWEFVDIRIGTVGNYIYFKRIKEDELDITK